MRCFIKCCLVALALCQSVTYAINLDPNKVYEYSYTGQVKVGSASEDLPASMLKFVSTIKITGDSGTNYFIQFLNPRLEGLTGVEGKDSFEPMTSVSVRIAAELKKPFAFHYQNGQVSHITGPPGVSPTVMNLCKGAIDTLAVTLKTNLAYYEINEESIFGVCKSDYIQTKDWHTGVVTLTRDINLKECSKRAAIITGMASAVPNALSKLIGQSLDTRVHYEYTLAEGTSPNAYIQRVHAEEVQHATPFNLKSGHLSSRAQKTLTLLQVTDKYSDVVCGEMEYKGGLMYKFDEVYTNIPLLLQEWDQAVEMAQKLIVKLSKQINDTHIDKEANLDYQRLYEFYRAMNASDIDLLWERNKMDLPQRALFLSTITECADLKMMEFIVKRFNASDLEPVEASQLVLIAFNHVTVDLQIILKAKVLLELPFDQTDKMLWKSVVLSYGSLIRKHIINKKQCSVIVIEPLMKLANETLNVAQFREDKMITILKSLGNAGCPLTLKFIRRLLLQPVPGRILTRRVLFSAIESLRLMADIDVIGVQELTRDVFINDRVNTEVRMMAVKLLIETRPAEELVNIIVNTLLATDKETLGIFGYSYLKSYSKSQTPDNVRFSSEANIAVSNLAEKYESISSKYNKAVRIDWFNEDLLLGQAASYFILNAMKNEVPEHIIISTSSMLISRILPSLEIGVSIRGLSEILQTMEPDTLLSIINQLKSSPNKSYVLTLCFHVFGQELYFVDVTRETLDNIEKAALDWLKDGVKVQWQRPFMVFEARFIQANCLGLQMELTKYYHTVTKAKVEVDRAISPLYVNHTIILGTRGSLSVNKDFWTYLGVNTKLFQCSAELKTKMNVFVPWDLRLRLDIDERKYSLQFPIPESPIDILKLSSEMHASLRAVGSEEKNIEIFPGVENDQQNEMKCHRFCPDMQICHISLFGGTEDVFTRPASFFFEPKLILLRLVPDPKRLNDKVRISIDLDPERVQVTETGLDIVSLLSHGMKNGTSNCTAVPLFAAEIVAMKGEVKNKGWALSAYNWEGRPKYERSFLLSEIGSSNNFKVCADTRLPNVTNSEMHFRFGSNCQPYKISLRSEPGVAPGFLPMISFFLNWYKVPDSMIVWAERIAPLIPGWMYAKGFKREDQDNPAQEVSAHYMLTVHRSSLVRIDFPKYSYTREDVVELLRSLMGSGIYDILHRTKEVAM